MTPPVRRIAQPQNHNTLALLVWLGVAALAVCKGLALSSRAAPFCELFVHFAVQYLAAGVVLALFALLARRVAAFALALGLGLSNLAPIWPYVFADAPAVVATGPSLRLVTANLNHEHADVAAVRRFLQDTDADLVILTELAGPLDAAFAAVAAKFPHRLSTPWTNRHRPFALLLLSRHALRDAKVHFPLGADFPIAQAVQCVDDGPRRCVSVIVLHAPRPGQEFGDRRDRLLDFAAGLAREVGQGGGQAIVAGDLNTTPWSPALDSLAALGLRDAGLGQGWQPTWPVPLGIAGIPIDHVLVSPRLAVTRYHRLDSMGSDHRPLRVDLRLPDKP